MLKIVKIEEIFKSAVSVGAAVRQLAGAEIDARRSSQ
jgi:hypothetical protein